MKSVKSFRGYYCICKKSWPRNPCRKQFELFEKHCTEAAYKNVLLKVSPENTCVGVFYSCRSSGLQLYKRLCKSCKFFWNTYFEEHLRTTASDCIPQPKWNFLSFYSSWTQHWFKNGEFRSNHQGCSKRKDVLKHFVKFSGKHLC